MAGCPKCQQWADDAALDNYLTAHNLRTPHPVYAGSFQYDPELVDEAEVAKWADLLLENEAPEMGIHDDH